MTPDATQADAVTPGPAPARGAWTRPAAVLSLIVLLSAVLVMMRFDSHQDGAMYDDAYYIVLAESLAAGRGYRLINSPDPPTDSTFPPGWPLLMAPLAALSSPGNYVPVKLLAVALWLGTLVLAYRLFSRRLPPPYGYMLVLLLAVHQRLVTYAKLTMSETAYLFVSLLALVLFDAWSERFEAKRRHAWLLVAAVLAAVYAQLVRTVGLSLVLALGASVLVSRRYRAAAVVAAVFIVCMAPQYWLYSRSGGSGIPGGYHAQVLQAGVVEKLQQMAANANVYVGRSLLACAVIPSLRNYGSTGPVQTLADAAIFLLIVLGAILAPRSCRTIHLYVIFYALAVLSFWNPAVGSTQIRFLQPLIPFLLFYALVAAIAIGGKLLGHTALCRRVLLACVGIVVTSSVVSNIQQWYAPFRNEVVDMSVGRSWVAANAPPDAVVMVRNPVPDYLYVRRTTVPYPSPGADIGRHIETNDVDYVIISPQLGMKLDSILDKYARQTLLPYLEKHTDRYRVVFRDTVHRVTVFEVPRIAPPRDATHEQATRNDPRP